MSEKQAVADSDDFILEDYLNADGDPNGRFDDDTTILMSAYSRRQVIAVIGRGGRVNDVDSQGRNALHHAVGHDYELVEALLDAGIPVDSRCNLGRTALHYACIDEMGDSRVIEILLDSGARINAIDMKGRTPVMYAAEIGSEDRVIALHKHGADFQLKDFENQTVSDFSSNCDELIDALMHRSPNDPALPDIIWELVDRDY